MIQLGQQRAFELVAEKMRRNYGRFTEAELFEEAVAALKKTAPRWSDRARREAAVHISKSISKKFDVAKSRALPRQSRGAKAKRNDEILRFAAFNEASVSSAYIAEKFGISKTTAYSILRKGGYYSKLSAKAVEMTRSAFQVISLFADLLPSESYRLVNLNSIRHSIQCGDFDAFEVFDEINASSQPLQLHILEVISLDGASNWVVVERGRRRSPEFLKFWGLRRAHRMKANPRLRTDQRVVLNLSDATTPQNPVLRDIAAVIHVSEGSQSLHWWRRYIEASTVVGAGRAFIRIDDPGALLNALNGAIRRDSLDDLLPKISEWLNDPLDRLGAAKIFSIARKLRINSYQHPMDAFQFWSGKTAYRQRVEQKLLPWRNIHDLDDVHLFSHISDVDELLRAFWKNPSDRIWPELLDEDVDWIQGE